MNKNGKQPRSDGDTNEVYSPMIRDMPADERPRERLCRYGAESLSNTELLAILLRTGTARESAVSVAERLLGAFQNLRRLAMATVEEIRQVHGIGEVKAIEIKAVMELGRRLSSFTDEMRPTIRTAQDVVHLVGAEMRQPTREEFRVMLLNTKNQVLAVRTVSVGTINASLVHPREVFREAISRSSHSIICVHNHPSGDPTPSAEDIAVTRRLQEAGRLIDIEVLDHVIIGDGREISLKDRGLM